VLDVTTVTLLRSKPIQHHCTIVRPLPAVTHVVNLTAAQLRSDAQLSEEAQYTRLLMCIKETRTLTDSLACFTPEDAVLSSAAAAEAQAALNGLQKKLPRLIKQYVACCVVYLCTIALMHCTEEGQVHTDIVGL
jgi:hypothetical protein